MCLLYHYHCTVDIEGFHLPGDPYFPNHGNRGWIEEDPEELIEEKPEEDPEEGEEEEEEQMEEDSDVESEVINPPYAIRNRYDPLPRPGFHGSAPLWAEDLCRRSRN